MALENKLGLTSSADLAREEERISKKKALELFENGISHVFPSTFMLRLLCGAAVDKHALFKNEDVPRYKFNIRNNMSSNKDYLIV